MGLYERLLGIEQPKIPAHQFMAALAERARGRFVNADVIALFQLTPAEQTEIAALVQRIVAGSNRLTANEVEDVLMLAEFDAPQYRSAAQLRTRFGV